MLLQYSSWLNRSWHFLRLKNGQNIKHLSHLKSNLTPCWLLMRCVTTSPHVVAILKIDILSLILTLFFYLWLSFPLSFQDVYKNQIQSENYSEEKWIIITHSCIACQFAFLLPCELWQIFSRTDLLYNHSIINGVVVWIFNPQTIM